MKVSMKSLVIAGLLAFSVVALAQGGGQGRGQGRGQGGMFGGMRGGGGPAGLVNREDVQRDIKVTDAQKKSLQDLQAKQREEQQARMQEMRNSGGGGFDREAMQKMMQENQAKHEKAVKEILDEKQWLRVKQIWVQLQGNRAILNAEVQKELKMTDEQVGKVKDLQAKQQEAAQSLMEKIRNQEITREEMQEITRKNNETMNTELGKILTPEQAAALKAMGGEPFKADENRGGGGL